MGAKKKKALRYGLKLEWSLGVAKKENEFRRKLDQKAISSNTLSGIKVRRNGEVLINERYLQRKVLGAQRISP